MQGLDDDGKREKVRVRLNNGGCRYNVLILMEENNENRSGMLILMGKMMIHRILSL